MIGFLLVLLASFAPIPDGIAWSHVVQNGVPVASFATAINPVAGLPLLTIAVDPALDPTLADATAGSKSSELSTPVFDAIANTYSTVKSTKGDTEPRPDFIRRHNDLVDDLVDSNILRAEKKHVDYWAAKKLYDATH